MTKTVTRNQAARRDAFTGRRVGLLTVVREVPSERKVRTWLCRCDCGNEVVRASTELSPNRKYFASCGCQKVAATIARSTKHGHAKRGVREPEYYVWRGMRERCRAAAGTRNAGYYSERGISVCSRWDDYAAFIADMGPRPGKGYSIDRIDVDGPYSPENCRWVDAITQRRNQRRYLDAHPEYRP